MTAARRQPDTLPPDVWRRLSRHLSTADVDWEFLLEMLEQGRSGRIEFHVDKGKAKTCYIYVGLRSVS